MCSKNKSLDVMELITVHADTDLLVCAVCGEIIEVIDTGIE